MILVIDLPSPRLPAEAMMGVAAIFLIMVHGYGVRG